MLAVSCDGGSGGDTASLIVPPGVLPLENSEGAEPGLRGCLNHPLYYNGPHFVLTTFDVTNTGSFGATSQSEQIDLIYIAVAVDEEDIAQVDVKTTLATSFGTGGNFTVVYTLDAYIIIPVGAQRDVPDENPLLLNYDLDVGESISQLIGPASLGAAGSSSTVFIDAQFSRFSDTALNKLMPWRNVPRSPCLATIP